MRVKLRSMLTFIKNFFKSENNNYQQLEFRSKVNLEDREYLKKLFNPKGLN